MADEESLKGVISFDELMEKMDVFEAQQKEAKAFGCAALMDVEMIPLQATDPNHFHQLLKSRGIVFEETVLTLDSVNPKDPDSFPVLALLFKAIDNPLGKRLMHVLSIPAILLALDPAVVVRSIPVTLSQLLHACGHPSRREKFDALDLIEAIDFAREELPACVIYERPTFGVGSTVAFVDVSEEELTGTVEAIEVMNGQVWVDIKLEQQGGIRMGHPPNEHWVVHVDQVLRVI